MCVCVCLSWTLTYDYERLHLNTTGHPSPPLIKSPSLDHQSLPFSTAEGRRNSRQLPSLSTCRGALKRQVSKLNLFLFCSNISNTLHTPKYMNIDISEGQHQQIKNDRIWFIYLFIYLTIYIHASIHAFIILPPACWRKPNTPGGISRLGGQTPSTDTLSGTAAASPQPTGQRRGHRVEVEVLLAVAFMSVVSSASCLL